MASACPGSSVGSHPVVERARRELITNATPMSLLTDARRAREQRDEVQARRRFSQALHALEQLENDHVELEGAVPEFDTLQWVAGGCHRVAGRSEPADNGPCLAATRSRTLQVAGLSNGDTLARFDLRANANALLAPSAYGPLLVAVEGPNLELIVPPSRASSLPPAADVRAVAFHPVKRVLAYVSVTRSLALFDVDQNQSKLVALPSSDPQNAEPISASVVFSRDGTTLTVDVDRDVYVVDFAEARVRWGGARADEFVGSAMSGDGRWVAWTAERGIKLLHVGTGRHRLVRGPSEVASLAFDPRGTRLAMGTRASKGQVWILDDVVAGSPRPLLEPDPEADASDSAGAERLVFSPDGTRIEFSVGTSDFSVLVADGTPAPDDLTCLPAGAPVEPTAGAPSAGASAPCPPAFRHTGTWDPAGRWWASTEVGGSAVRVVDAAQNATLWTRSVGCQTSKLAFSFDSRFLLASGADCLGLFEVSTGRRVPMPGIGTVYASPRAVRVLDDSTLLVTTDRDGLCTVSLDRRQVECTTPRWHWYEPVLGPGALFIDSGSRLARSDGRTVQQISGRVAQSSRGMLASVDSREAVDSGAAGGSRATADPRVALDPRATATPPGTARATLASLRVPKGAATLTFSGPNGTRRGAVQSALSAIDQMGFDPNDRYFAAWGKGIEVWQLPSYRLAFRHATESVKAAAFGPDGKRLAFATADRISWYATRLGRVVAEHRTREARALAVGPDDRVAAAVPFPLGARSPQRSLIQLLDFGTSAPREIRSELVACLPDAQGIAFTPDGTALLVACPDAILWLDVTNPAAHSKIRLLPDGAVIEGPHAECELYGQASRWLACRVGETVVGSDLCEDRYVDVGILAR